MRWISFERLGRKLAVDYDHENFFQPWSSRQHKTFGSFHVQCLNFSIEKLVIDFSFIHGLFIHWAFACIILEVYTFAHFLILLLERVPHDMAQWVGLWKLTTTSVVLLENFNRSPTNQEWLYWSKLFKRAKHLKERSKWWHYNCQILVRWFLTIQKHIYRTSRDLTVTKVVWKLKNYLQIIV